MERDYYPALYQAASKASTQAQTNFLNCIKGYAGVSIIGAGLAAYGVESKIYAFFAAVAFLLGLFLSILMAVKNFSNTWYRARAVAESIKTSSWKFMMCAEPFEDAPSSSIVKVKFRDLLKEILKEHEHLAYALAGPASEREQITKQMCEIRDLSLNERIDIYRRERLDEQRTWYTNKSKNNKLYGIIWFVVLVLMQAAAIIFILLRIAYPNWKIWPTEIFVVGASNVFTWLQVRRFGELAAAYGIAAHEIGLIRGGLEEVASEEQFSKFVKDAELAFSREHTQWVARKD